MWSLDLINVGKSGMFSTIDLPASLSEVNAQDRFNNKNISAGSSLPPRFFDYYNLKFIKIHDSLVCIF